MDNYSKVLTFFMENGIQLTLDQIDILKEEFLEETRLAYSGPRSTSPSDIREWEKERRDRHPDRIIDGERPLRGKDRYIVGSTTRPRPTKEDRIRDGERPPRDRHPDRIIGDRERPSKDDRYSEIREIRRRLAEERRKERKERLEELRKNKRIY